MRILQELMGHRGFKTALIHADYAPSEREAEWLKWRSACCPRRYPPSKRLASLINMIRCIGSVGEGSDPYCMFDGVRTTQRNVKRWRDGDMRLR